MGSDLLSVGRRLLAAPAESMPEVEAECGLGGRFDRVDALAGRAIRRFLAGEPLAQELGGAVKALVDSSDEALLQERFALDAVKSRGCWHVPDELKVGIGILNFGHNASRYPRYAMTLATDQTVKARADASADHVLLWSLLEPTFRGLIAVLLSRSYDLRSKTDESQKAVEEAVGAFRALSTGSAYALQEIDAGSGWERCDADERARRRSAFLRRLESSLRPDAAARMRLLGLRPLLERYYAKAKSGPPTQRQVENGAVAASLVAHFGGDWLAFLDHIGEAPHPDERIVTALPRPRVVIEPGDRTEEIARRLALPPEKVAEVVAKFWNAPSATGPVERRLSAMELYWSEFQAVHDRQSPGMTPLWGLVAESENDANLAAATIPYTPGLYDRLLSESLNRSVESLWSQRVVPELPDVLADCPTPHAILGRAFGPALRFWHGCSLTAWFLCEGPYSRTDMSGLEHYHRRELARLVELGCPIDPGLFEDLVVAERSLVAVRRDGDVFRSRIGDASLELSISLGVRSERKEGFERLRDAISTHRRRWSERYLRDYLRRLATTEIEEFAKRHAERAARTGKAPSLKSLVAVSKPAADHWFGGDLRLLYAAIGEPIPEEVRYVPGMPADVEGYRSRVYALLVGNGRPTDFETLDRLREESRPLKALANRAPDLLRMRSILGRTPTQLEFARREFEAAKERLGSGQGVAWERFVVACDRGLP